MREQREQEVNVTQSTPKRTLVTGIVVTAVGTALLVLSGQIVPNLAVLNERSWQPVFGLVNIITTAIHVVAIPLGCAFIAAGTVMRYLRFLHNLPKTPPDTLGR